MSAKQQNILLLGGGGRECTLAWKLKQSPLCGNLFIAPGNAGTAAYGTNLPLSVTDFAGIKKTCIDHNIDIVLPGPEDPLVAGIYDFIKGDADLKHIIVAGPSKEGAQLEGSKAFSKRFMERHNIPTAAYREFTAANYTEGEAYIRTQQPPVVLKADGLAAGKGVVIAQSTDEALTAFHAMIMDRQFGEASSKVVIEQFLDGIELSVFALTDGANYVLLPEAKDYKRIGEGDTGLNTGGMGAISPVPFADATFMQKVISRIVEPTVNGLKAENIIYNGFIFFGLIKVNGEPYVIEYNCRMGDPETEVVMPRLENDLVELLLAMGAGKLNEVTVQHSAQAAGTVMLVSGGYPGDYAKGKVMTGFNRVNGSMLFHAGTASKDGAVVTSGGRVLAITSYGANIKAALAKSYENAAHIQYDGIYYRKDIGWEF
jgi:phosphoribosylamine--glycine ligase